VPQNYGVAKKWNFLCNKKRVSSNKYDFDEIGDIEEEREGGNVPVYDYETGLEDADSKAERNYVYNLDKADYYKYPLIIKDIRKEYPGIGGRKLKVAVKNCSLRIKKGEFLGLLGPNGAGKTTLISLLTGLYPSTRGNAWVAGFDIKNQLEAVQLQLGFCPQFDVLWDHLTITEHL
jgi:ABC-type glutathione transport system ATPase component